MTFTITITFKQTTKLTKTKHHSREIASQTSDKTVHTIITINKSKDSSTMGRI